MSSLLSTEQRLTLLRASDATRAWRTLNERRICMVCGRIFSGEEIRITPAVESKFELHCPTDGCASGPHDWFFHGSALAGDAPAVTPPGDGEIDFNFG